MHPSHSSAMIVKPLHSTPPPQGFADLVPFLFFSDDLNLHAIDRLLFHGVDLPMLYSPMSGVGAACRNRTGSCTAYGATVQRALHHTAMPHIAPVFPGCQPALLAKRFSVGVVEREAGIEPAGRLLAKCSMRSKGDEPIIAWMKDLFLPYRPPANLLPRDQLYTGRRFFSHQFSARLYLRLAQYTSSLSALMRTTSALLSLSPEKPT